MHILMLHQYFKVEGTGPQTRFFALGRRLVAAGHQVTVITTNAGLGLPLDRKKIGLLQKEGLAVVAFNLEYSPDMQTAEKRRVFLAFARQASRQGRRLPRPGLVLASSPPLTVARPALSLSRRYRVPLILEVRELWPDAPIRRGTLRNKTLIKLARRLEQKAYQRAFRIITTAPGIADAIKASGAVDHRKIVTVPGYPDDEELFAQFCKIINEVEIK